MCVCDFFFKANALFLRVHKALHAAVAMVITSLCWIGTRGVTQKRANWWKCVLEWINPLICKRFQEVLELTNKRGGGRDMLFTRPNQTAIFITVIELTVLKKPLRHFPVGFSNWKTESCLKPVSCDIVIWTVVSTMATITWTRITTYSVNMRFLSLAYFIFFNPHKVLER